MGFVPVLLSFRAPETTELGIVEIGTSRKVFVQNVQHFEHYVSVRNGKSLLIRGVTNRCRHKKTNLEAMGRALIRRR